MLCRGECIVVQQLYLCPGAIQLAYVTLPITVPSIGTSIEVLRLTRDRLQCHVSGESNPLQVLSPLEKTAGHWWSVLPLWSWAVCMGSGGPCTEPGGGPLAAVVSSNQVGRIDLTPIALPESVFLILSRRRLWYIQSTVGGTLLPRHQRNVTSCGLFVVLLLFCVLFVWFLLLVFVLVCLWRLRDGLLDCVQVLYQFTLEAPQSADGHVYALINK